MRQSTFSPTAGGLLTGVASPSHKQEINAQGEEEVCAVAASLAPIAAELGCTVAQLAIAWVVRNPDVAVCVFGSVALPLDFKHTQGKQVGTQT